MANGGYILMRKFPGIGIAVALLTLAFSSCTHSSPDWECVRDRHADCEMKRLCSNVNLPPFPLNLEDILSIALQRNLDLVVKERELAIQHELTTRQIWSMLPSLTVSGEYSERNKDFIEVTKSLTTGTISSGSIVRERFVRRWDATYAWSLLDFGLAYYRSRQEWNRSFMVALEYHRTRQNLIYDIITQYWDAMVAKKAVDSAKEILVKTEARQKELEQQISKQLISEVEGLRNQDRLVAVQLQLRAFERRFLNAKATLASLMGLPPGCPYELEPLGDMVVNGMAPSIEELECTALRCRPELFAQDAQEAIMVDEVKAAILEMFPNTTLFTGIQYDGDRYIINNEWLHAGIRATWNLLSIPRHLANQKAARLKVSLVRESRLQLAIGVLTQVHLADIRYHDALKQHELTQEQYAIKKKLLEAASKESRQGTLPAFALLDYEIDALLADINLWRAYAEIQMSMEQLSNSIGRPLHYNSFNLEYTCQGKITKEPKSHCITVYNTPLERSSEAVETTTAGLPPSDSGSKIEPCDLEIAIPNVTCDFDPQDESCDLDMTTPSLPFPDFLGPTDEQTEVAE